MAGGAWLGTFTATIPAIPAGHAFLDTIPVDVPARSQARLNAHRERYCLVASLRWLACHHRMAFPATVSRHRLNQAPDFVLLTAQAGKVLGLEHTDAGTSTFQRWLDQSETEDIVFLPSPNDDGWVGDGPEEGFCEQLTLAIHRKQDNKCWITAPPHCHRIMLLYDNTSTGQFVSDGQIDELLTRACRQASWGKSERESVLLVRSQGRVFAGGALRDGIL